MQSFPPINLAEHLEQKTLTLDILKPYALMLQENHPHSHNFLQIIQKLNFKNYCDYLNFFHPPIRLDNVENYLLYQQLRNALLDATPLDFSCYQALTSKETFHKIPSFSKRFYTMNGVSGVIFILQHDNLIDNIIARPKVNPMFLLDILINFSNRHFFKHEGFHKIDRLSAQYFQRCIIADKSYMHNLLFYAAIHGYETLSRAIIQKLPELAARLNSEASFEDIFARIEEYLINEHFNKQELSISNNLFQKFDVREITKRRYEDFYLKFFENLINKTQNEVRKVRLKCLAKIMLISLINKAPRLIERVVAEIKKLPERDQEYLFSSISFIKSIELKYQLFTHRLFQNFWEVLFSQDVSQNFKNQDSIDKILSYFFNDLGIPAKLLNAALNHNTPGVRILKNHLRKQGIVQSLCLYFPPPYEGATTTIYDYLEFRKFPELFSPATLSLLHEELNINMLDYLLSVAHRRPSELVSYNLPGSAMHKHEYKIFYMNFAVLADLFLSQEEVQEIHQKVQSGSSDNKYQLFLYNYRKGLWSWGIHHLLIHKNPVFYMARHAIADTLGDEQALNFIWDIDKYPRLKELHDKYENMAHKIEQLQIEVIKTRTLLLSSPSNIPTSIKKSL